MGQRLAELVSAESIATAGTKFVDLNIGDPISRIVVQLRLTNDGSTPTAHPATAISKIEISDGSDLLFSLSGKEVQALNFYDKGHLPFALSAYENNIMATVDLHLDFGRFLWDKELALDPKRFNNLQLKITHNKAAGASSPDAGNISVVAHVFDEANFQPSAFLMSKQVYSYALAASGEERIVLPSDFPYRKILFGSLYAGSSPSSQLSKVKLAIDNDRRILINSMSVSDIIKMLAGPAILEAIIGLGTGSAVTYFIVSSYEQYMTFAPMGSAQAASVTVNQGSGGTTSILSDSSEAFQAYSKGYAPHGLIALPQGDQMDADTWLQSQQSGNIVLTLKAGGSVGGSSTAEVIAQQRRTY